MENPAHRYDGMLDLPHHVSRRRPQMSRAARAAQFASFKALTGYEDCVTEAARLTEERIALDDMTLLLLNRKLQLLREALPSRPAISVTYFVPDKRKSGGEYVTVGGRVKHIDEAARTMLLTDHKAIPLDEIADMEGELFAVLGPDAGMPPSGRKLPQIAPSPADPY